jgi:hypothetical protein
MSDRRWTVDDVQALVSASMKVDDMYRAHCVVPEYIESLQTALAPFQPDPDAELVLRARVILDEDGSGFRDEWVDPRIRAIIAAVREHDRGKA